MRRQKEESCGLVHSVSLSLAHAATSRSTNRCRDAAGVFAHAHGTVYMPLIKNGSQRERFFTLFTLVVNMYQPFPVKSSFATVVVSKVERAGMPPWPNLHCFVFHLSWRGVGDRTRGGYGHGRMANGEAGSGPFWGKPEWCGEDGYYKMLASSFAKLLASGMSGAIHYFAYLQLRLRENENQECKAGVTEQECVIDCASYKIMLLANPFR